MALEQRSDRDLGRGRGRLDSRRRERGHVLNAFSGLDVEEMSPKAQVAVGLVVILPILLSAPLFFTVLSDVWWIFMTYAWAVFPAFGLLIRGILGFFDNEDRPTSGNGKERELLGALREYGELAPARAAMETSLTVSEADEMLSRAWPRAGTWRSGCGAAASRTLSGGPKAPLWSPGRRFSPEATRVACVV